MSADVYADDYYAIVPEWVLNETRTGNAVKLYALLRRYADKASGEAHPSRRTLAKRMRFSRPQSIDPIVRELVEIGALEVFERWTESGDQDSNGYRVLSQRPHGVVRETAPPVVRSSARQVVRQTAHNPQSQEPQSVEPQNQDSSSSVTEVDASARADDDESYPQVAPHLVDTRRIVAHVAATCGREITEVVAYGLIASVLERAKQYPAKPTAYVMTAITRDPVGWQKFTDTGKVPR